MAKVSLKKDGPFRVSTRGILFERGKTQDDVPSDVALALKNDPRFRVEMTDDDYRKAEEARAKKASESRRRPENPKDAIRVVMRAIQELDVDNEDNFTSDGRPNAVRLTEILGWSVTKDDRDEAMRLLGAPLVRDDTVLGQASPPSTERPKPTQRVRKIVLKPRGRRPQAVADDGLIDTGAAAVGDRTEGAVPI